MIRAPHVLVLTLVLVSCGGGTDRTASGERSDAPLTPSVSDSAGITIYAHPADALERAPLITIDTVPLAVIGDRDNVELDLSQAYRGLLLSGNRVATFVSGSIWIFDADGNELERIGRSGAGPQEFRMGQLARGLGDTILVTDMANRRLAVVVPGAGVVRTRAATLASEQVVYEASGQIGDDDFLLLNGGFGWTPEMDRVRVAVGRLAPGSDSITELMPLVGPQLVDAPSPMGGAPQKTVLGYEGLEVAALWGSDLLVVRPAHWQVERLDTDGTPRAMIRVPRPRRPMTATLKAAEAEAFAQNFRKMVAESPEPFPPGMDTARVIASFRDRPTADSIAHFGSVITTANRLAWLGETNLQSDPYRHYTAVRADGTIVGRLSVLRDQLVLIGDDRVILRNEDDDGIVTWRVHRLVMPSND